MHVLDPDFDPNDQLDLDDLAINAFGSVTDCRTGWIHHHELSAHTLGGVPSGVAMRDVPEIAEKVDGVRERTAFLFRRMREHCQQSRVIFVRWLRHGHPDGEWNEAFDGETPEQLHKRLEAFCGHDNLRVIYVISEETEQQGQSCDFQTTPYGAFVKIFECVHNYRDESWTGDDLAWTDLFERLT